MANAQEDLGLHTLDTGSQDPTSASMIASFQGLEVSTPIQNTLVQLAGKNIESIPLLLDH
jgi:hypothetical protein